MGNVGVELEELADGERTTADSRENVEIGRVGRTRIERSLIRNESIHRTGQNG